MRVGRVELKDVALERNARAGLHVVRGTAVLFHVFHVVRDYLATLRDGGSRYAGEIASWADRAALLEAVVGPIELVFGHNDLLASNFIDDGKRLWTIETSKGDKVTARYFIAASGWFSSWAMPATNWPNAITTCPADAAASSTLLALAARTNRVVATFSTRRRSVVASSSASPASSRHSSRTDRQR